MIDHYNAFISYKHAPLDNKVAAHVQSKLEHFHIPAKIRKKTGVKQIQRVFRDKDELPITSDLSATIAHALENSDYLIVICSYSTKESIWVQREIEFFLKNHSRQQILAVLAEGEPSEVLPQELCHEEVKVVQPDGTESVILREKEPLCCDYRLPLHKADKEELPRLAAALIGCSYDELMNRRRAYQMRKITILSSILAILAIGFTAYLITNQIKIEKSYKQTLRNQSIYLANESQQLLSQNNRVDAIQLALAALPVGDSKRPVTDAAIRALSDATLAYQPLSGSSILPVWNYQAPSRIKDFIVSPERSFLACYDYSSTITVWRIESHEVAIEQNFANEDYKSMAFIGDDQLLVVLGEKLVLFDLTEQSVKWTYEYDSIVFNSVEPICCSDNESFYLVSGRTIYQISSENGDIIEYYDLPTKTDDQLLDYLQFALSPDESKIAFSAEGVDTNYTGYISLEDEKCAFMPISALHIRTLAWVDDSHIVACGSDTFSQNLLINSNTKVVEPRHNLIACYDTSTNEQIWANDFSYIEYKEKYGFLNMSDCGKLAYFCGNRMDVYDSITGDVIFSYDVSHPIVHINDNDQDGVPMFITDDGAIGAPLIKLGAGTVSISYDLVDDIDTVDVNGGIYVLQKNQNQIIFYDVYVADDEFEPVVMDPIISNLSSSFYLDEDYLVVPSLDPNGQYSLYIFDSAEEEYLFEIILDQKYSYMMILGVDHDNLYVAVREENLLSLLTISIKDEEIVDERELSDHSLDLMNTVVSYRNGKIVYIYWDEKVKGERLMILDLKTGNEEKLVLPMDVLTPVSAPCLSSTGDTLYYADKELGDYIVFLEDHEVVKVDLPKNWATTTCYRSDSKGERWIVANKSSALVLDKEGKISIELKTDGHGAIGAAFYKEGSSDEQILVVFGDELLYRYDAETGEFLGSSKVEAAYYGLSDSADMRIVNDGKELMIMTGSTLGVVNTDSWVEVAVVYNALGYHESTDRFFAYSYASLQNYQIGTFRHYTLQDLVNKAYDILGSAELSEDKKSRYGIG